MFVCAGADHGSSCWLECVRLHRHALYMPRPRPGTVLCNNAQVACVLEMTEQQLLDTLPPSLQAAAAAASSLKLQQRAQHVFSEAQRVLQCVAVCNTDSLTDADKLAQLGELMNASHTSCAALYECSCAELDKLVDTARAAGAIGARLTGRPAGVRLCRACTAGPTCTPLTLCAHTYACLGAWAQVPAGEAARCRWCGRRTRPSSLRSCASPTSCRWWLLVWSRRRSCRSACLPPSHPAAQQSCSSAWQRSQRPQHKRRKDMRQQQSLLLSSVAGGRDKPMAD